MRGEASLASYSRVSDRTVNVAACTRALASPRLLPTQRLRKAHLLRARATGYIEAGDMEKALADLDAAQAAAGELAQDRFYARSMGVSLSLLRAVILAQQGDTAGAVALARAAAEARPYALQVQRSAATLIDYARAQGGEDPSPWGAFERLSGEGGRSAFLSEADLGNYRNALALQPGVQAEWPTAPLQADEVFATEGNFGKLTSALIVGLHGAYARAATGDGAAAREQLAEVRKRLEAARPTAAGQGALAPFVDSRIQLLNTYVEVRGRQIEARVAVLEGRPLEAVGMMVANPLPSDAASIDLIRALKAALPEKEAALAPDPAPIVAKLAEARRKELRGVARWVLIAPETPRSVVDYEKSRPQILSALLGGALSFGTTLLGGIKRGDGFRTTDNPDGTVKVEFVGNTPSAPLVQEMTLLRAAEVARAAGKPGFVIVDRQDFSRRMTTTRYNVEVSSVPTGFKTELTIRYVEPGAPPPRALDATAIIDALGPLYYEDKPAGA